jgi:hypothetical protein
MTKFSRLTKELFLEAKPGIQTGPSHHILASFDDEHIILYQAYKESIAKYAVEHQQLSGCPDFSLSRMTWIKPNFLWMAYRSSWSTAKNQEHILAIWIKRDVFDEKILGNAVISSWNETKAENGPYATKDEWQKAVAGSDIRLQWDPYHSPKGGKLEDKTRCIQLGLRNAFNRQLATNSKNMTSDELPGWIEHVEDVTDFFHEQLRNVNADEDVLIPVERLYPVPNPDTRKRIFLTEIEE